MDWVVIEPDDELRTRIHAWAEGKRLDLDALEVAACKLREPRSKMLRTLSNHDMFEAAFPSSQSLPRLEVYQPLKVAVRSAYLIGEILAHTLWNRLCHAADKCLVMVCVEVVRVRAHHSCCCQRGIMSTIFT